MENDDNRQDALQLEALLVARAYLYGLFHKLFGGVPNAAVLDALLGETTADAVEELSAHSPELVALNGLLASLAEGDRADLLDRARSEHARVFLGPGALPASPYESPYTGAHDMSLFQENTLEVRGIYHAHGLAVRREQAVPDDHVALMCAFMAELSRRALAALHGGDGAGVATWLRDARAFAAGHLANWLGVYAKSVRNSKAGAQAVLYPQMIEALEALVRADMDFCGEAAFWAEGRGAGLPATGPSAELESAYAALAGLDGLRPLGIQDNELVSIG